MRRARGLQTDTSLKTTGSPERTRLSLGQFRQALGPRAHRQDLRIGALARSPGGEVYKTPDWIMQGYEWETLPMMDKVHEEFNAEFGTDFEFPLRPEN